MDFEQIRIFLVLAEERTFLGAANRLGTSRSRVRRKLDQLESDAGTLLLTRKQNGLCLTPAGASLAVHGRELLEEADNLVANVREIGHEPTGCLRIAMSTAPPPIGWDNLCHVLQKSHADLTLDISSNDSPESLIPSQADVAVSFVDQTPSGCHAIELARFSMNLVAGEAYLSVHGTPARVEDLSRHRVGVWRLSGRPVDAIPLRSGAMLRVEPRLVCDDPARLQRSVIAGDCIGYLPAMSQLIDPGLKVLFAQEIAGSVCQRLFVPRVLADVPRVARLVELCRADAS